MVDLKVIGGQIGCPLFEGKYNDIFYSVFINICHSI